MKELPKRKPTRLQGFDYNSGGAYFLTLCTKDRKPLLSTIVGRDVLDAPQVQLTNYGVVAERQIRQMNEIYEHISVEGFAIMPDHIHILLVVQNGASGTSRPTEKDENVMGGASRTSRPTKQHSAVSRVVSTFKRFCNKQYGENVWQDHFNDHIIRNQEDFDKHWQDIDENPLKWRLDDLYIREHPPTNQQLERKQKCV